MAFDSKPETRPCEGCGKPVSRTGRQNYGRKHWTCSSTCTQKVQWGRPTLEEWRGRAETRPCVACGVPVTRKLTTLNHAADWFCSNSCTAKATWGRLKAEDRVPPRPHKPRRGCEVACPTCGKLTYKSPGELKAGRRFCSRACNNAHQARNKIAKACSWCGKLMTLAPSQVARQYCSQRCMGEGVARRPLDRMHNGRPVRLNADGYVLVWEPDHPRSFHGWIAEHRLVAEAKYGRPLAPGEHVHHLNEMKDDNRPENLEAMPAHRHCSIATRSTLAKIAADRKLLAAAQVDLDEAQARIAAMEAELGELRARSNSHPGP